MLLPASALAACGASEAVTCWWQALEQEKADSQEGHLLCSLCSAGILRELCPQAYVLGSFPQALCRMLPLHLLFF